MVFILSGAARFALESRPGVEGCLRSAGSFAYGADGQPVRCVARLAHRQIQIHRCGFYWFPLSVTTASGPALALLVVGLGLGAA